MEEDKIKKIKEFYVLAEMTYKRMFNNQEDIFPIDWYSSTDYVKKIEILGEAIAKNILIIETDKYKTYNTVKNEL